MSSVGMPSVMQTASGSPASAASMIASAAHGGGTKITDRVRAGLAHALGDGVEHRPALVRRAALAGRHAADDRGAVGGGLLGVERAFAAGDALDDAAACSCRSSTAMVTAISRRARRRLLGRLAHRVGGGEVQAAVLEHLLALLDVRAFHADDDRHAARRAP